MVNEKESLWNRSKAYDAKKFQNSKTSQIKERREPDFQSPFRFKVLDKDKNELPNNDESREAFAELYPDLLSTVLLFGGFQESAFEMMARKDSFIKMIIPATFSDVLYFFAEEDEYEITEHLLQFVEEMKNFTDLKEGLDFVNENKLCIEYSTTASIAYSLFKDNLLNKDK
jgi:hypothetical protein